MPEESHASPGSLQPNRVFVIACVMSSMFMVAIEATIVSTVMPQIVAELGGLVLYSWVFSSFLLAQTAMTVVFGNLADIYGRKPVMICGIAIFLVGSLLAGFARSMPSMILFRLIQGIGAGAMQTVAMTIVADLYPARERGKIQGYLGSVWAIAAILGPIAGGLIVHQLSWSWIFWINIPIGLVTVAGFMTFLRENVRHERRSIDVLGAISFTILVTSFLVALTEMGGSRNILAIAVAVFCASTLAFVWQERRAPDPMVSFALWSHRPIAASNGVALLGAMALIGLTTFLPVYVQIVLQRSPVIAGLALTTMLVGWPVGATLGARLFHRVALRRLLITGSAFLPLGAACLLALGPQSSAGLAGLGSLLMGFGMGLMSVSSLVLVQETVASFQLGRVTASLIFSRNVGSTLGATALGAVFTHGLTDSAGRAAVSSEQIRLLLGAARGNVPGDSALRLALQDSLHLTFWTMLALSLATVLIALWVPATGRPLVRE